MDRRPGVPKTAPAQVPAHEALGPGIPKINQVLEARWHGTPKTVPAPVHKVPRHGGPKVIAAPVHETRWHGNLKAGPALVDMVR